MVVAILAIFGLGQSVEAVDTVAPTITQITSDSPDGYYIAGDEITIRVNFSEPVYTVGTSTIVLTSGLLTRCYFSIDQSSASSTASCIYTVSNGDSSNDLDLRYLTGDIYDETGNAMTSFVPAVYMSSLKNIIVDTSNPNATITTTVINDYYDAGDIIPINVKFSESVYAGGEITINLNASSTASCAFQIATSSPSTTGSCNYIVGANDDASNLSVSSITGNIYDLAGNTFGYINSNLANGIHINTDSPRLIVATSTASDGRYKIGDIVPIHLTFSESVYSSSDITINLNASATGSCAFQIATSSPLTTGSCNYVVGANDSTADLSVSSITGSIYSVASTNILLNYKIRDENIDDNSDIIIDGVLPLISTVRLTDPAADSSYGVGSAIFTVTFSEAVSLVATSTISFDIGSCNLAITSAPATTASCEYSIINGYNSDRLYISGITGDIYDQAGNHQTTLSADDVYFGSRYIVIDTVAPTSTLSNTPAAETTDNSFSITVAGTDVLNYKYRLDGGAVSGATAIATPITLTTLSISSHTLEVIGQDLAGNWQDIGTNPTTATWNIIVASAGGGGGGGGSAPAPQVLGVKIYSYASGRVIKTADSDAVYHITDDGKRHLYPNSVTYWTWHTGTWADQNLETISQEDFDALEEGEHITVKPDSKLIRFYNSPRIYIVSDGAVINYATSDVLLELYGNNWESEVIKIQNGFENDYSRGEPLTL
ncbi:MAG: hypothetical protein COT80_04585 [Candidatus Buchananbacteria bacterium CG10_big_fil_rev_8_21_14_0_10_33_19]|uniref:SbsA Ig-like domain-containing protein n=1 Tax=Candidatus Buchananbacteria bacterium CG10_big_fil_rev_8_21_14_0_10_33_19 TaxID=1974525 RepID=A0A2H0W3S4_9BACT|nr:MAG: hypothetical protein COT80_04585 [Candidatus Buchananbacteria bacterium CG10_big_fil_rev_8_21_14_0_10_33_19]